MNQLTFFCPPLFGCNLLRIDNSVVNRQPTFEADCKFFQSNAERRYRLRDAHYQEFDAARTLEEFSQLPYLHVLVIELSERMHLVLPVYRSKSLAKPLPSDVDVLALVAEYARCGGVEATALLACVEYEQRFLENSAAVPESKSGIVH